jgi:hypothetical protein
MAVLFSSSISSLLRRVGWMSGSGREHVQHASDARVPTLYIAEIGPEDDQSQGNLRRSQIRAPGQLVMLPPRVDDRDAA